ncbi:hypothetical protein P775_27845 [Puniceibacterium antarcticum]|uniref:DeoR-like transcriptional repressor C-terminal sensor domain-containing protein n=1 Tax=Puniceibacterium antarcticum TaxID=1206336 RepID=A0A2G8QWZ3_9RHOB|nr:hypothetical protein P775_27845 [Puniceibacterium antarcticum]
MRRLNLSGWPDGRFLSIKASMRDRNRRLQRRLWPCAKTGIDHHQRWDDHVSDGPSAGNKRCQVFTNSFPIAEHLLKQTKNTVMLSGGTIYREQNIILSPFDNDVTRNFYARRMFTGCQGIAPLGIMEADLLVIQAEQKLIGQADELVVLADSSKFDIRSSLILCGLEKVGKIITDEGIEDRHAAMMNAAEVTLIVVPVGADASAVEAGYPFTERWMRTTPQRRGQFVKLWEEDHDIYQKACHRRVACRDAHGAGGPDRSDQQADRAACRRHCDLCQ